MCRGVLALAERSRAVNARAYDDFDSLVMVYLALGADWQPNSVQPQVNKDLSLERLVNASDTLAVCHVKGAAYTRGWGLTL